MSFYYPNNVMNFIQVQQDLCSVFPKEHWSKVSACISLYVLNMSMSLWMYAQLHLQFIYFGREYCTAKQHVVSHLYSC